MPSHVVNANLFGETPVTYHDKANELVRHLESLVKALAAPIELPPAASVVDLYRSCVTLLPNAHIEVEFKLRNDYGDKNKVEMEWTVYDGSKHRTGATPAAVWALVRAAHEPKIEAEPVDVDAAVAVALGQPEHVMPF